MFCCSCGCKIGFGGSTHGATRCHRRFPWSCARPARTSSRPRRTSPGDSPWRLWLLSLGDTTGDGQHVCLDRLKNRSSSSEEEKEGVVVVVLTLCGQLRGLHGDSGRHDGRRAAAVARRPPGTVESTPDALTRLLLRGPGCASSTTAAAGSPSLP